MASSLSRLRTLVKEATIEKSIEEQFLYELERTMEKFDLEERRQPSTTYKPSSLGGCLRNMYYQVTGTTQDVDSVTAAMMISIGESGTDRHERIQKWITRMNEAGYECEWVDVAAFIESRKPAGTIVKERKGMETKCYNEILNISFLCDGVVRYKGRYYIIEIKTEEHFKYVQHFDIHGPHVKQACTYSVCLGIDDIIFIYENRNLCQRKPYMLHVTDEMKNDNVIGIIETVEEHRRNFTLPPKTDNTKDCNYCKYKKKCKMEFNSWLPSEVDKEANKE
jgi:CRISPR/Cas system-associated exonuclease Cas4 (RecB family)